MRVAALYDVHGNLPALAAVLDEIPDDAEIVVGGDVAAGPFPSETLERLRALGDRAHWLRGNADREIHPDEHGLAPERIMEWVRSRLSDKQVTFLHELPPSVALHIDGLGRVLFVHATPRNDLDIFTERTPEERVAPCFGSVDAGVVVCGHTHTQFERQIAGVRVVNSGSVGMPYEDAPGAYWTLFGPGVERRRTPYAPQFGDYPDDWPSSSRDEAVTHFETVAVGA